MGSLHTAVKLVTFLIESCVGVFFHELREGCGSTYLGVLQDFALKNFSFS